MLRADHLLCVVSPTLPSDAFCQAVHLAVALGATLHIVGLSTGDHSDFRKAIQDEINRLEASEPLETHVELVPAGPARKEESIGAIEEYVKEVGIDLVVVGAPTDRGPVPPLAETATRHLIEHLECPVFVVGEGRQPDSIQRILVLTDLSDRSLDSLRCATELAESYDASVVFLHVIDTSPYVALNRLDRLSMGNTTLSEHRARRRLNHMVQTLDSNDVTIHARVAFGEPTGRIARYVQEENIDLLVLSSHGTGARSEQSLGRVSNRLLHRITCSTFLVRSFGRSLLEETETSAASSERSAE